MTKITNTVQEYKYYKSKDYDKFDVFTFNRPINDGLVNRIITSIEKIGYMAGKPIIVDKSLAIIDGQHRFQACMKLGIDIIYVISHVDPHTAIIECNANQVHWKTGDFIHAWAEQGVKCYKDLEMFEAKYHMGMSNTLILNLGLSDNSQTKNIKTGKKFIIDSKVDKKMEFLLACKIVPYWKTSYFVKATVKLFEIANDKQIKKIQDNIMSLPQQATAADYIVAFENMVNRKVKTSNRVSFKQN